MAVDYLSGLTKSEEFTLEGFGIKGKPHTLRIVITPELGCDGVEVKAVYVSFQDIHENLKMQSELSGTREELERYLSAVSCGIIQYTRDTNRLLYANGIALQILGYESVEDMQADRFDGVVGTVLPEDAAHMKRLIDGLKNDGDKVEYDYHVRHKDGKELVCLGSAQLIVRPGEEPVLQRSMIDITDSYNEELRKAHDEVVKSANITYSLLDDFENVYVVDTELHTMEARRQDGLYAFDTDRTKNLTASFEDTIGYYIDNLVHPADREGMRAFLQIDFIKRGLMLAKALEHKYRSVVQYEHHMQIVCRPLNANSFILAVRNIDSIVKKEAEQRVMLEQALSQSDEFLTLVNELTESGIWYFFLDDEGGCSPTLWSSSAANILHYRSAAELPQSDEEWLGLIHPEDAPRVTKIYNQAQREKSGFAFRYRMKLGTGEYHWFSVRGKFTRFSKGVPHLFFGTFNDIQKAVDAEETEIRRRTELEEVYNITSGLTREYTNVYIVHTDDATIEVQKQSGYVPDPTKTAVRSRIPYEYALRKYIQEAVYAEDQDAMYEFCRMEHIMQMLENQEECIHRYRRVRGDRDGKESREFVEGTDVLDTYHVRFLRLADGRIIIGFRNINQFVKQEEMLQEALDSARRSNFVSDALGKDYLNIYLIHSDERSLEVVKQQGSTAVREAENGERMEQFEYDETWQYYCDTYVYPDDRPAIYKAGQMDNIMSRLEAGEDYTGNYRILRDGEIHYMQFKFVRLSEDTIVASFRNVDSIMRQEAEQRKLVEEALAMAEHANKAKSVFLNNMSHDIRTPMNAIIGYTALATSHVTETEKVKDYLHKIHTSSNHLLSLINDVLDMSRIESGRVEIDAKENSLSEMLHDLRNIIQADVKKKQLSLFLDTVDVKDENVWCDRLRVNQVLLNVLSNAIKFTPAHGSIALKVTELACDKPGFATYEFRVKDSGIGMSREFLKDIFVPFTRERTSTVSGIQGTGLGMAIVKNIIDMMGGAITVESEQGKGTEFIITLTFKKADENGARDYKILELQSTHALVVDDNYDTCESVCRMLSEIGMRPEWTMNGHDAVLRSQYAKNFNDPFGVYVIDLMIPDMNGIEVVRRIRKDIGPDTPIIILSSYDFSEMEEEAKEAGVTAFISKPMFMSELVALLENAVKPKDSEAEEQAAEEEPETGLDGVRILLVEDNEMNREIAEMILGECGALIESVNDGKYAVERMQQVEPGTYDLIFMDVQMPIMNGYEATRRIRRLDNPEIAGIPIVALSANAMKEDREQSKEAGMDGHISKPFELAEVIETVNRLLNRKK
ncbi:MAG: response regulator [Bacteroidaceae bacterium]|nr:response regulator [Bacteroidaceae bacterium]